MLYSIHQDNLYYPLDTNDVVTLWIPLVKVSKEMGTMHFAKGSHKNGYIGFNPIGESSEVFYSEYIHKNKFKIYETQDLDIGDVSLHHGWVIHGAPPNITKNTREAIVIAYYPDGTKLKKPLNVYQERVLKFMYRGLRPGQNANGFTNDCVNV